MKAKYYLGHYIYTAEQMFGVSLQTVATQSRCGITQRGVLVPMESAYEHSPYRVGLYRDGDYMLVTDEEVEQHALAGVTYGWMRKDIAAVAS